METTLQVRVPASSTNVILMFVLNARNHLRRNAGEKRWVFLSESCREGGGGGGRQILKNHEPLFGFPHGFNVKIKWRFVL